MTEIFRHVYLSTQAQIPREYNAFWLQGLYFANLFRQIFRLKKKRLPKEVIERPCTQKELFSLGICAWVDRQTRRKIPISHFLSPLETSTDHISGRRHLGHMSIFLRIGGKGQGDPQTVHGVSWCAEEQETLRLLFRWPRGNIPRTHCQVNCFLQSLRHENVRRKPVMRIQRVCYCADHFI